jgi:hypothetical protein
MAEHKQRFLFTCDTCKQTLTFSEYGLKHLELQVAMGLTDKPQGYCLTCKALRLITPDKPAPASPFPAGTE